MGCLAPGPSATHDDQPSGGSLECGALLSYERSWVVSRVSMSMCHVHTSASRDGSSSKKRPPLMMIAVARARMTRGRALLNARRRARRAWKAAILFLSNQRKLS